MHPIPKVGDIVLFVLDSEANHPGEVRPAIVVRVWSETVVNLQVLIDGENDYPSHARLGQDGSKTLVVPSGIMWKTSVELGPNYVQGTWHWPSL